MFPTNASYFGQENSVTKLSSSWLLPVAGFMIYAALTVLGYVSHQKMLNTIGFMTQVFFVSLVWLRSAAMMRLRFDITTHLSLLALFFMVLSALLNPENIDAAHLVKYISLFILYIMVFSSSLPALTLSPKRKYLLIAAVFVILLSLSVKNVQLLGDTARYSGIFPNPNVFALFCFVLLLLISDRDSIAVKTAIHFIVIISLMLASGSGALLAYAIGMAYHYFSTNRGKSILLYFLFFSITLAVLYALYIISGYHVHAIDTIITKLSIIYAVKDDLLSGTDLNYGELADQYGASLLSGIWRLDHWRHAAELFVSGNLAQILFGHGQGSAFDLLGNDAHNDLVRFLLEVGIVGTCLIVLFFYGLFRRLAREYKYVAFSVFVYSLSENNFDGFLFMTVFIFLLASNQENLWPLRERSPISYKESHLI